VTERGAKCSRDRQERRSSWKLHIETEGRGAGCAIDTGSVRLKAVSMEKSQEKLTESSDSLKESYFGYLQVYQVRKRN
jgi:hypothetical protein